MDKKYFLDGYQCMIIGISIALFFLSSLAMYCAYIEGHVLSKSEVFVGLTGIFFPLLCSGCVIVDKIKECKKERSRMVVDNHV